MFKHAVLAFALSASCAFAQPGKVELTTPPALADGVDAFPKLIGDNPIFAQINADLSQRDANALAESQDCLSEAGSDWSRSVDLTFVGQKYLSYLVTDGYYCAKAAHPNTDTVSVVYDLKTGIPVHWSKLLPPFQVEDRYSDISDGSRLLGSEALTRLYLSHYPKAPDDECPEILQSEELLFIFWLDGTTRSLVMLPASLPYVLTACENPAAISFAELRSLGAAPELINALAAN